MVQEPWINKDRILGFGTSDALVYRGSNGIGPRSCILTKGVTAFSLPQFGDRDRLQRFVLHTRYVAERYRWLSRPFICRQKLTRRQPKWNYYMIIVGGKIYRLL